MKIKTKKGLRGLLYDQNNDLWIGTLNKGLYKIFFNDALTYPFLSINFRPDGIKILARRMTYILLTKTWNLCS